MANSHAKARRSKKDAETETKRRDAQHDDAVPESSPWTVIQQSIGNAAVSRLVGTHQRASSEGVTPIDAEMQSAIETEAQGGTPVDESVAGPASEALGGDVSGARVHTGPAADRMSRSLHAYGFTQGQNVFLRSDRDPSTPEGQETLTHELTHVAEGRAHAGSVQRDGADALTLGTAVAGGVLGGPLGMIGAGIGLALQSGGGGSAAGNTPGGASSGQPQPDAPQQNATVLAMFDGMVVTPAKDALAALQAKEPDYQKAYDSLGMATKGTGTLIDSYRSQGKVVIANTLTGPHNSMIANQMALRPKLGFDPAGDDYIKKGMTTDLTNLQSARSALE